MGQKRHILRKYIVPLAIARRLKKRYGLHAQSFGPFEFYRTGWIVKQVFKYVLAGAEFISVRETASVAALRICSISKKPVRHVLDPAFFLSTTNDRGVSDILDRYSLRHKGFVACTFRLSKRGSQADLPSHEYTRYAARLAEFVLLWITNTDIPLAMVCQVPKDVENTESVLSCIPSSQRMKCHILTDRYSPELLMGLYANAICVLGMRFHSLVFALAVGTPVMGLYYYDIGPKIRGLMHDIGQPQYAHALENTHGRRIYDSASHLVANARMVTNDVVATIAQMRTASLDVLRQQVIGHGPY